MTNTTFSQMPAGGFLDFLSPSTLVTVAQDLHEHGGNAESILFEVVLAALYRNCGEIEGRAYLAAVGIALD